MSIPIRDVKLLWGRAAAKCSLCKCKLSEEAENSTEIFPLGEQAHIVAEQPNGPRGNSILSKEDRNSYFNLILLCPRCHSIVDTNIVDYPIERLYIIKVRHEQMVERTFFDAESNELDVLTPLDRLFEYFNVLKPICFWMHHHVPKDVAAYFLESLQVLVYADKTFFVELNDSLVAGIDTILRPFVHNNFLKLSKDYQVGNLLHTYRILVTYFRTWTDGLIVIDDSASPSRVLSNIEYSLDRIRRSSHSLSTYEILYVRFLIQLVRYLQDILLAQRYLDIPEGMTSELYSFLEPFCENRMFMAFPDKIDFDAILAIRKECLIDRYEPYADDLIYKYYRPIT